MWDIHYSAAGEDITDSVELGIYFYPKGQEPKYRQALALFSGITGGNRSLDIQPNSVYVGTNFHVMRKAGRVENFQPHMHLRGKAMSMEAILPTGQTQMLSMVSDFSFNWHNNYVYADDAAPLLPKGTILKITSWHDNTAGQQEQPRPESVGGLGRSHGRRDGARVGEHHLHGGRGLQGRSREAQAEDLDHHDEPAAAVTGCRKRRRAQVRRLFLCTVFGARPDHGCGDERICCQDGSIIVVLAATWAGSRLA